MTEVETRRGQRPARISLLCLMALAVALPVSAGRQKPAAPRGPVAGQFAPGFTLMDGQGRVHSLTSFHGRRVALFFFCGCQPCHECAQVWAQAQADLGAGGTSPQTVIVFSGDAAAARTFADETGLLDDRTTLLIDTQDRVTDRYHVRQCPRFFVLDASGHIQDTNPDPNAPAVSLVSRALSALRRPTRLVSTKSPAAH